MTKQIIRYVRSTFTGVGQVMFQPSWLSGLIFLIGIFAGAFESGMPAVAWGALVGLLSSTVTGYMTASDREDGESGLWGFNGILTGCAFPTFLAPTPMMWVALILCSSLTVGLRKSLNSVLAQWGINSLTFPFVVLTWIFLLAARAMNGIEETGLPAPELSVSFAGSVDLGFVPLAVCWLKGISQVFLIDSWLTGAIFLVGLAVNSRAAAFWAMVASALSLATAIFFEASPEAISNGLYGFSPVLTAIALGCVFRRPCFGTAAVTLTAIVATVFVQAAMNICLLPFGLPTLTAPFCVVTWAYLARRGVSRC